MVWLCDKDTLRFPSERIQDIVTVVSMTHTYTLEGTSRSPSKEIIVGKVWEHNLLGVVRYLELNRIIFFIRYSHPSARMSGITLKAGERLVNNVWYHLAMQFISPGKFNSTIPGKVMHKNISTLCTVLSAVEQPLRFSYHGTPPLLDHIVSVAVSA